MNFTWFVFSSFLFSVLSRHEACILDVLKLDPEPITLNTNYEFIYPTTRNDSSVEIKIGEKIIVSCPGTDFLDFPGTSTMTLVCNEKDEFQLDGIAIDINYFLLNCSSEVVSSIQYTNRTCAENSEIIEIGFQLDSVFVSFMEICFNTEVKSTLYSNYFISQSIVNGSKWTGDDVFLYDEVFDSLEYSIEYIYDNGRATLNSLVGLSYDSDYYIAGPSMYPDALGTYTYDLFYTTQIQAARRTINMWPQWLFGAGIIFYNWDQMTNNLYDNFLTVERLDLQVYVGTLGVVVLEHVSTGEKIPIYLYVHDFVEAVPLPAVTWKLLYHEDTKRAIVLLTVNTPYNYEDYVFCKNIIGALSWLDKDQDYSDPKRGFTYACSYHMLKGVIPYLPELDVVDILV